MTSFYFTNKMFSVKYIVLFSLAALNLIDQPTPEITIDQGVLTGKVSSDGKVFEYFGIPYGTVGAKFQAPLPPPSWKGVYRAIHEHYHCIQAYPVGNIGTEDCLRINIYVPISKLKEKSPLAVMVYIHGGAYVLGNGGRMLYGPEYLIRHDVIVVSFNYRLGPFGFLCLGIKEAPGNVALKDQIAALRWIKKNIRAFGGDPDNVTIFGHSAGAVAVSLLIASEATEGLFNRAIVQSGTAISFWSVIAAGVIARNIAKRLGYDTEDPYELFKIFNELPLDKLSYNVLGESIIGLMYADKVHLPCIENKIPGEEAALPDLPYNLLIKNPKNISIIYGITDTEGLYLLSEETEESLREINKKNYFFYDLEVPPEEAEGLSKKIKNFYFGDKTISQNTVSNVTDMYGDIYLSAPTLMESEIMINHNRAPIYNYYFKYAGGRNWVKHWFCKKKEDFEGASHGDDILYIFTSFVWPYKISEKDQQMMNWLTKMWTNYAKYGDPTPPSETEVPVKWKPSTKDSMNFLYIDEKLEMGPLPRPERYKFWKDIYQRYRKTKF